MAEDFQAAFDEVQGLDAAGSHPEAAKLTPRLLELARATGADRNLVSALGLAANARKHAGDLDGAREAYAELAERFSASDDLDVAFRAALAHLGVADLVPMRDARAPLDAAAAVQARLAAGGHRGAALLALETGPRAARVALAGGDPDAALERLRWTLHACAEPDRAELLPAADHVAHLLALNRNLELGVALLRQLGQLTPTSEVAAAIGGLYASAGRDADALAAYRDAAGLADDELARAGLLTQAGLAADRLGEYATAAQLYEAALDLRKRFLPPDHPDLLHARYNVAELARVSGGDLDEAAAELEAVADALRAHPAADTDLFSLALKNLAQARIAQDRPADAETLVREALALGTGGPGRRAQLLVQLGQAERDQGREPDVVPELEQLADALRTADPDTHLWLVGALATFLPDDRAVPLYEQVVAAIGEPRSGGQRDTLAGALVNLGLARWGGGDHAAALDAFRRASTLLEEARAEAWRVRSALETDDADRLPIAGVVAELVLRHLADDAAARAFAFRFGTASKRIQAEALRRQRELVLEGETELLDVQALATRLRVAELAGDGTREDELEQLDGILARQVPRRALLDAFASSEAAPVSAALPRRSVLVEYLRCRGFTNRRASGVARAEPWYVAFVLPSGDPDALVLVDLGDAGPVDDAVLALRAAIAEQGDWRPSARAAAELLWDPVAPLVDPEASVIVAPDGQIGALPFDALVTGSGRHLLEERVITVLGTGRDAELLGSRPNWQSEEPVVVGAPEYGEPWAPFAPLPATQREANRVARMLGVSPALGEAATRDLLLGVRSPEVLHLATHGYYDTSAPSHPLVSSGVALANANLRKAGFEGVATALDVLGVELYGTDLAVLSACESGLGPVDDGEGLVSLARSFVLAGARSVLWTLWRVDDWATAELMEGFYTRLLRETPRGAALYRAKRDLLAKHPDRPDLWAGFVLQGDPDALVRYRFLMVPPEQHVTGAAEQEGDVTLLDSGQRLFTSFEVPAGDAEPLRVASLNMRNLSLALAEDRRAEAIHALHEGRVQDAVDGMREALETLGDDPRVGRPLAAEIHAALAVAYGQLGDLAQSREQGLAALEAYAALEDWPMEFGAVLDNLAAIAAAAGDLDAARLCLEHALAFKEAERPAGHPSIDFTRARLAALQS